MKATQRVAIDELLETIERLIADHNTRTAVASAMHKEET